MLSVVIPTLNAAESLPATLENIRAAAAEIIIADGGSADGTQALADGLGATVIDAPPGRGSQLATGAEPAKGEWLMFLHADTILETGWAEAAHTFMADPNNENRAAVFTFALDDPHPKARRIERWVAWRCRKWALPYGDQGLLISRAFYDSIGGFKPIPLYEDVDIILRIGRARLDVLAPKAITSAIRYQRGGYTLRPLRNLTCLSLYFAGVAPRVIGRLYK
jgi:rSAM/selenodomain-associated transferase 2